jgi:hypothetical protein
VVGQFSVSGWPCQALDSSFHLAQAGQHYIKSRAGI